MPLKGSMGTSEKQPKETENNLASTNLKDFYKEDPKGPYFDFYSIYRRREAVKRGEFKGKLEDLEYGSVYQKWVNIKKNLMEIPLAQITIACKFIFDFLKVFSFKCVSQCVCQSPCQYSN